MSKSAAIKRRGENSNNEGGSDTATAPLVKKKCIKTAAANDEGPYITTGTRIRYCIFNILEIISL